MNPLILHFKRNYLKASKGLRFCDKPCVQLIDKQGPLDHLRRDQLLDFSKHVFSSITALYEGQNRCKLFAMGILSDNDLRKRHFFRISR